MKVEEGSLIGFWRRTKSAELASVMMEDTLALIGLVLIAGSAALMFKSGSLLLGENISDRTRGRVVSAVESTEGVERLINMQALHMDEDAVLLCLKVQTSKLDRDFDVDTVNKIEANIRKALP